MTPHEFVGKWRPVALTERQTAQEHFIDLCRLANHPTPIEEDPAGERFLLRKRRAEIVRQRGLRRRLEEELFRLRLQREEESRRVHDPEKLRGH
jgi:hypothetical protein